MNLEERRCQSKTGSRWRHEREGCLKSSFWKVYYKEAFRNQAEIDLPTKIRIEILCAFPVGT